MSPDLDAELAALLAATDTDADDVEEDDADPFTELADADFPVVSLVSRAANGHRMLLSKSALNPQPKVSPAMPPKKSTSVHVHVDPVAKADDLSAASHDDLVQQATSGSAEQRRNALAELGRRVLAGAVGGALPEPAAAAAPTANDLAAPAAAQAAATRPDPVQDLEPAPKDAAGVSADQVTKFAEQMIKKGSAKSAQEALILGRAAARVQAAKDRGDTPAAVELAKLRAASLAAEELQRLRAKRAG